MNATPLDFDRPEIGPRRKPFYAYNEHGTPISVHACRECGSLFAVCPAVTEYDRFEQWEHCLDVDCPSYDPSRDASIYFELGMVERDDEDDT